MRMDGTIKDLNERERCVQTFQNSNTYDVFLLTTQVLLGLLSPPLLLSLIFSPFASALPLPVSILSPPDSSVSFQPLQLFILQLSYQLYSLFLSSYVSSHLSLPSLLPTPSVTSLY